MLAKHSGAKIEFQKIFEKSRDWNIEADRLQMMELMMNLLDNAVIAMKDKGGRLTVSLSKSSDDQDIYIVITDEGSGISAEVLPNIFNPFYSTRHNGIGLGLTICQQLVYLHQGTIEINSRKDEGTTVKLTLPAKHPQ
jgi:signal transduction histidine kinase